MMILVLIPTRGFKNKIKNRSINKLFISWIKINVPVISSPMDSVTGIEMAKELIKSSAVLEL